IYDIPLTPRPLLVSSTQPSTTQIYTLSLHDALPISSTLTISLHARLTRPLNSTFKNLMSRERISSFKIQILLPKLLLARVKSRRSEEHTSELQSRFDLVCRLLLEKKNRYGAKRAHT